MNTRILMMAMALALVLSARAGVTIDTGFDSSSGWTSSVPASCYVDTANSRLHTYFHILDDSYIYHSVSHEREETLVADIDFYAPFAGLQYEEGANFGFVQDAGNLVEWRSLTPSFAGLSVHANLFFQNSTTPHFLTRLRVVDSTGNVVAEVTGPGDAWAPDKWQHLRLTWNGLAGTAMLEMWDGTNPGTANLVVRVSVDVSQVDENWEFSQLEFGNGNRNTKFSNNITFYWDDLKVESTPPPDSPDMISYQGRLSGAGGMPVDDGSFPAEFSLWNSESGSTVMLWSEPKSISVDSGIYSVNLGGAVPFPSTLLDNYPLYLQVEAGGEVMSPRKLITAVPYAMRAADADALGGDTAGVFVLSSGDTIESLTVKQDLRVEGNVSPIGGIIQAGNTITVESTTKNVVIKAQNTRIVVDPSGGITIESASDVTMQAAGDLDITANNVNISAMNNFSLTSGGRTDIDAGLDVDIYSAADAYLRNASNSSLHLDGSTVDIDAPADVDVDGATIHLN